jgi:hypothetical protein
VSHGVPFEIQFHLRAKPVSGVPRSNHGEVPQVMRVLALAIHLDNMIRRGEAKDYADISRLSCLCRERVSQIMRLNYLAPDIQIELLYLPPVPAGRYPISETAMRKIANILSWAEQRSAWSALKQQHHID